MRQLRIRPPIPAPRKEEIHLDYAGRAKLGLGDWGLRPAHLHLPTFLLASALTKNTPFCRMRPCHGSCAPVGRQELWVGSRKSRQPLPSKGWPGIHRFHL